MNFIRRAIFWFRRHRLADELREEMETHRALREDALARDGAADPATASRRALGNVALAADDAQDVWVWPWLDGLVRDLRYAVRLLRRRPAFAATCITTIAIGTAALMSVLSVVYAVLLSPPPYPNHARVVQIGQVLNGRIRDEVSAPDVLALRTRGGALSAVTIAWTASASMTGGDLPERARLAFTDSHAFSILGTPPELGRVPTAADEAPGATPVVVIGHNLWASQFAADPAILGRPLKLDGVTYTVIGVMPTSFRFPAPYWAAADLWALRRLDHPMWPDNRDQTLLAFGLIAEGATVAQAQQETDAVAAALTARYPKNGALGLRLSPYAATVREGARPRLLMILGAAAVVLLIVCVNVVNLLLGRSVDRHRELAARTALGAGRARLVRQLITETLILFALGGAAGVLLAVWGSKAIVAIRSFSIPRMEEAVINVPVAVMALAAVLIAAFVVGTVIALHATSGGRLGLDDVGARGASQSRRWRRVQRVLVGAEVGLSLVLLCGAGVLLEGARVQARVDPGFDTNGLLHARLSLAREKYATLDSQRSFFDRLVVALGALPGVRHAGVIDVPPGVGGSNAPSILLDGEPMPTTERELRSANVRMISPDYPATIGLTPRAGRAFTAQDREATPVVLVNEAFVARHLDGTPAIGRQIRVALRGTRIDTTMPRTIVGVLPDVKEKTVYEPTPPTVYLPIGARDSTRMAILVRADRGLGEMTPAIRRAIASVDPEQAGFGFMGLGDLMNSELSLNKLTLQLLGTLSAVALLLAVIGVYGVTAHAVRQRTREIAIRLALGMTPSAVQRLLLGECGWLIAAGFVVGGTAALWSASLLRSLVYGINHTSWTTFAAAAAVLAATVLAGCYVPARRAARVDPALVLRAE